MSKGRKGARPPKPEGIAPNPRQRGKRDENQPSFADLMRELPPGTDLAQLASSLVEGPRMVAPRPSPEKDRHAAIVGAAAVEHALKAAITQHLKKGITAKELKALFESYPAGALTSFSDRIGMADALGVLLPGDKSDLAAIKNIRNVFAHSVMPRTFDEAPIAAELRRISVLNEKTWEYAETAKFALREQFVLACAIFCLGFSHYRFPPIGPERFLSEALRGGSFPQSSPPSPPEDRSP